MPRVSGRNTGGSLAFNGSNTFIDIPSSASINTITTSATVSMYVYRNSDQVAANEYLMISGGSKWFYRIDSLTGGLLRFYYDGSNSILNGPKLKKGWQHVVTTLSYNGTNITGIMYVNGVFFGSQNQSGTTVSINGLNLTIGAGSNSLNGKIEDVCVWNRALTATEVSSLYFNNVVPTNGLVTRQLLQEMTGSTALDTSGNANNGTIVSGTWSIDRPFANRQAVQDIKATSSGAPTVSAIDTVLPDSTNSFTMIGKVKASSHLGNVVCGIRNSASSADLMRLNFENNTGYPFIWTTNTALSGTVNPKVSDKGMVPLKQWISYAFSISYSGGNITGELYINGQLWGTQTQTRDIVTSSYAFLGNSTEFTHADVSTYNRKLTATEILTYHNTGVVPSNPKIYWKGTEGAGNIKYDSSGNGANGTGGTLVWSSDTPTKARRQVGGNMMINGDFETPLSISVNDVSRTSDGHAGNILGAEVNNAWYTFGTGGRAAMLDTSVKYSGTRSIKLSTTDAVGVIQALKGDASFEKINVLPNTSYTITAQCKTNNVAALSAYIGIACEMADGTYAGAFFATNKLSGTNDWSLLTSTFTTTATTRRLYIYCYNIVAGNISDAWYDNISLVPTSQLTASAQSRLPSNRLVVGGNLIANGDMSYIPAVNVATTINQRWVDGTSTGSTANSSYKIGGGLAGTASAMFDTTNLSPLGSPSLKLSTLAVSSYVDYYSDWQASTMRENTIPVLPNTSYTVSYYMKTNYISGDSANGARMVLFQRAGDLTGLTSTTPIDVKTTTGWTLYTNVFTTGANVRSASWAPRVYGHTGAGTLIMDAWFANITLTPTVNTDRKSVV